MILIRPSASEDAARGYVRRTARIESSAKIDDVWFMTPADTHPLSDDWLLPVGAVVGMALGEDVHIAGRVSEMLLASMDEIQRIAVGRQPGFERIRITTEGVTPTARGESPRVVSCFSGGVDAFYTLLELHEGIDELLYVHGFEARVKDERLLALVLPRVRTAAAELGKPLRLAETNWGSVIEPLTAIAFWGSMPMLASIAYLMGSDTGRLIMPGTHDPFFTLDDPSAVPAYVGHWRTEGLEILEHGHVPRFDKVLRLTESDVAMRHLRVCWARDGVSGYNCGVCGKCLRTRVHLELAGLQGRCSTLPLQINLDELRNALPERPENLIYIDENIAAAESRGMRALADALRFQRLQQRRAPSWWHSPGAKLKRSFRRLRRSYRKRRIDASLRSLKIQHGDDHLFNCLDTDSAGGGLRSTKRIIPKADSY